MMLRFAREPGRSILSFSWGFISGLVICLYFDSQYPGVAPWAASIKGYAILITSVGFISGLIAKQWENIGVGGLFFGHVVFMGYQLFFTQSYLKSPWELLMLFIYLFPAVVAAALGCLVYTLNRRR